MTRQPVPLYAPDLSRFARSVAAQIKGRDSLGHVECLNILARAAGFRNVQHLHAAAAARARLDAPPASPVTDHDLVERALRHFGPDGRFRHWPARRSQQVLCLWVLWSALPAGQALHERDLTARLAALQGFGDAALLRRDMIGLGLLARNASGTEYLRREQPPPPEARDLIGRIRARRKAGA